MARLVVLAAAGACAAPARKPDGHPPPPDAILCRAYDGVRGHSALLWPGRRESIAFGALRLDAEWSQRAGSWLEVGVFAGEANLFYGAYPLRDEGPPLNPDGFTGTLRLTHPTEGGAYQVSCVALNGAEHSARAAREEREHRAVYARSRALHATLRERERCGLPPALASMDGPRCPPKQPLAARVAALHALHASGARGFTYVDLEGASLDGADLRESSFPLSRLTGASLREAQLYFGDFSGSILDGANLERANLYGARLNGSRLTRANLKGAKLQVTELAEATFDGAQLDGAFLIDAKAQKTSFSGASLAGAFLIDANFSGAKLVDVDLDGADLSGANLDGADLSGAKNLAQYQLDRACGDYATKLPDGLTIDRRPRQCLPGVDYVPCGKQSAGAP